MRQGQLPCGLALRPEQVSRRALAVRHEAQLPRALSLLRHDRMLLPSSLRPHGAPLSSAPELLTELSAQRCSAAPVQRSCAGVKQVPLRLVVQ